MSDAELSQRQKIWRAAECVALFVGVPGLLATGWVPVLVIPVLVIMAIGCGLTLRWRHQIHIRALWRTQIPKAEWRRMFLVYLAALSLLVGLLWWLKPDALFSLMLQHPKIWALVMVAYPVVSVFPQELIYRAFFFERYRVLFGRGKGILLSSAAVFSFGHLVFHNWPAVTLTFVGGYLFGRTYQRTKSLLLVSAEHALYGCALFTIGYGQFFFDGTMRLFR